MTKPDDVAPAPERLRGLLRVGDLDHDLCAIGLALRFLSGFSATRRYRADASYWLYLIHLPILMVLQVAVSGLDWPWPVKFAAIMLIALPLMFASYQWLARYSFIGTVLNGRRERRERTAVVTTAGSATA